MVRLADICGNGDFTGIRRAVLNPAESTVEQVGTPSSGDRGHGSPHYWHIECGWRQPKDLRVIPRGSDYSLSPQWRRNEKANRVSLPILVSP
jgi:hypothetical protein